MMKRGGAQHDSLRDMVYGKAPNVLGLRDLVFGICALVVLACIALAIWVLWPKDPWAQQDSDTTNHGAAQYVSPVLPHCNEQCLLPGSTVHETRWRTT
jgi:hypothetical protein